jgi:acyl CoA:acetate/3-ketoacid CoA transferase
VSPGIEIERDILPHMDFRPVIGAVQITPEKVFE